MFGLSEVQVQIYRPKPENLSTSKEIMLASYYDMVIGKVFMHPNLLMHGRLESTNNFIFLNMPLGAPTQLNEIYHDSYKISLFMLGNDKLLLELKGSNFTIIYYNDKFYFVNNFELAKNASIEWKRSISDILSLFEEDEISACTYDDYIKFLYGTNESFITNDDYLKIFEAADNSSEQ